jgi:hypothetical protein
MKTRWESCRGPGPHRLQLARGGSSYARRRRFRCGARRITNSSVPGALKGSCQMTEAARLTTAEVHTLAARLAQRSPLPPDRPRAHPAARRPLGLAPVPGDEPENDDDRRYEEAQAIAASALECLGDKGQNPATVADIFELGVAMALDISFQGFDDTRKLVGAAEAQHRGRGPGPQGSADRDAGPAGRASRRRQRAPGRRGARLDHQAVGLPPKAHTARIGRSWAPSRPRRLCRGLRDKTALWPASSVKTQSAGGRFAQIALIPHWMVVAVRDLFSNEDMRLHLPLSV